MEGRKEQGLYRDEAGVSCNSVEARNVKIKREESISLTRLRDMIVGFPPFVLREPRGPSRGQLWRDDTERERTDEGAGGG